jgi:stage V sporulation protein SpoVS
MATTSSFSASAGAVAATVVDRTTEAIEASAVHTRIMASAFAQGYKAQHKVNMVEREVRRAKRNAQLAAATA